MVLALLPNAIPVTGLKHISDNLLGALLQNLPQLLDKQTLCVSVSVNVRSVKVRNHELCIVHIESWISCQYFFLTSHWLCHLQVETIATKIASLRHIAIFCDMERTICWALREQSSRPGIAGKLVSSKSEESEMASHHWILWSSNLFGFWSGMVMVVCRRPP